MSETYRVDILYGVQVLRPDWQLRFEYPPEPCADPDSTPDRSDVIEELAKELAQEGAEHIGDWVFDAALGAEAHQ